jgi:uncharacterized protein
LRRAAALPSLLLLCAVAWVALTGIAWPARALAIFLLVLLPALLVVQARMMPPTDELPRTALYLSSVVAQWIMAGVTVAAAWASGLVGVLGFGWPGAGIVTAWAAGLTAAALALVGAGTYLGMREAPIVAHLLPQTRGEKIGFAGVSLTAGFCEELMFRGFLLGVLHAATGSLAVATILSSAAFGVVHAYQQPAGALRAGLLGVLLAVPVLLYGSIWPAVVAHAAIDLTAGLLLRERLIR